MIVNFFLLGAMLSFQEQAGGWEWLPGRETALNLLIIFLIYLIKKTRRLRQVQWLKRKISADLHDEFGSRLTNLQFLSVPTSKGREQATELQTQLERIGQEVQAMTEALDEIVWNMKMPDENFDELVAKMVNYAQAYLEDPELDFKVEVGPNFQGKRMKMSKRRELFLIFKELLNNIRKHSRATQVRIQLAERDGIFHLCVEDNGIGFDPVLRTERNGLKNLNDRIIKRKGSVHIDSKCNQGCRITLSLPFDNRVGLKIPPGFPRPVNPLTHKKI